MPPLLSIVNFPLEILGLNICKIQYEGIKLYMTIDALEEIEANLFYNQYAVIRKIQKGDTVVDLGAHQGTFTIPASKLSGENGLVIAVEPIHLNFSLLVNNVMLNRCNNVLAFRRAVYIESGKQITMYLPIGLRTLSESASVFLRKELFPTKKMRRLGVPTINMWHILSLISNLRGYDTVDFLKIDIEGYELPLLTLNNSWLQHVNFITGEFHNDVYGKSGEKRIIESLHEQGFKAGIVNAKIRKSDLLKKWLRLKMQADIMGYCLYRALTCIKPGVINLRLFYAEKS
jgi:FkbM family methyltransferase